MPDCSPAPYDSSEWLSAAELAALAIPGLPSTRQGVQRHAETYGWNTPERENLIWRNRQGRGGGVEYNRCVLTSHQQAHLLLKASAMSTSVESGAPPNDAGFRGKGASHAGERWAWYDRQTDRTKTRAQERLAAVNAIYALTDSGIGKTEALNAIARSRGIGISTLQVWDGLVRDLPREHWLPHLAPGHGGGRPQAECDDRAWDFLTSLYLKQSRPNLSECLYQTRLKAADEGWTLPAERTLRARVMALPETTRILRREGEEALKRRLPAQRRDKGVFHALEALNTDFHTWDVFVKWPDETISRPEMVAYQDLYSGKVLAWRLSKTPSWHEVRLAFGDVVEQYGIPQHCWMDNGREFASKRITGGQKNRYRFKLRDDEPEGLMTALGVQVHFTTPYHGQAKPIERAFRDMAQRIARHPAFDGAYAGNSPMNKPANYGQRAVPLDEFLGVVRQGIIQHNARPDRQSPVCRGRSFDQVFAESFSAATVKRPTVEQRRLWLLAAEGIRARRQDGKIVLAGNEYYAPFLANHMGRRLTVRFDPERLHEPLHVYTLDGRHLGEAPVFAAVGFNDVAAAQEHARLKKGILRSERSIAESIGRMSARELAKAMPKLPEPEIPQPAVFQVFTGNAVPKPQAIEAAEDAPSALAGIWPAAWTPRVIEGGEP